MKYVIVIDPVLTGSKIVCEAKDRGFGIIGIMSWKSPPQFALKTFPKEHLSEFFEIACEKDLVDILSTKLAGKDIVAVFPGTECSVDFAEKSKSILGLNTNDPATSKLRRNKFKMHQALKKQGLAIPPQIEATSLEEIIEWIKQDEGASILWPIVLKPLESAGTDGLTFSADMAQLQRNSETLFKSKDLYGKRNRRILVQSFMNGTEYIVNTMSDQGRHKITDLWKYTKRKVDEAGMIYDRQDLLPIGMASQLGLQQYIFKVLDALEIKYGPAHSEVMLTKNGPMLVESASRIQGGINTKALNYCLGTNQLSIAFDVALSPSSFEKINLKQDALLKHACWVNLICRKSTIAKNISSFEKSIKNLKSYLSIYLSIEEGQPVKKTVDLVSCPGVVFLVDGDPEQIEKDYNTLREFEQHHY